MSRRAVALTIFLILFLVSVSFTTLGCQQEPRAKKLRVLASFLPIYVFARNVAGDTADVELLLPPGAGPHDYAFTPRDVRKVGEADVFVINGVGLETWLDRLISAAGKEGMTVIDTSRGIELLAPAGRIKLRTGAGEESTKGKDRHIWLDPINVVKQVENIRDGLVKADPENAASYRRNAQDYISRLRRLDRQIRQEVAGFQSRDFVAFHSAFTYFAHRYGLRQVAAIEPFPGQEPSPQYLIQVVNLIKELKIKAVFSEPQFSPRVVETLASDLGIKVLPLDPMETAKSISLDLYEKTMLKNLEMLKEALG